MPHAVDLNFWKKTEEPKTRDVVIFSSLGDYEKRLKKLKETTNQATFDYCMDFIEKAMDRDNFMNPEEAKEFGLIDHIVKNRLEIIK